MIKPISPEEALQQKQNNIPDVVFEAFNELIVEKINMQGTARITQSEAVKKIIEKSNGALTREIIFEKRMLDVEPQYRESGWKVEYDKPGYNEDYEAYYIFEKQKHRYVPL